MKRDPPLELAWRDPPAQIPVSVGSARRPPARIPTVMVNQKVSMVVLAHYWAADFPPQRESGPPTTHGKECE
jgi:hypothetical protein